MEYQFRAIGVLGMSGFGKTIFTEGLIRPCPRVAIFDYQDDDAYDNYTIVQDIAALSAETKGRDEFAVCFRGKRIYNYIEAIEYTAEKIRDAIIVFDEISVYAPAKKCPEVMNEFFFRGRRRGYKVLWNAQRAQSVDISVRAQTHAYVVFRTIEDHDLEYLKVPKIMWPEISNMDWGQYQIYRNKQAFLDFLKETR